MMQKFPLVSVIIAVYNQEKYLGEAIVSVLADDYPNKEILVIDDGSDDETGVIARGFKQVKYYRKNHTGVAATRNLGILKNNGEFITYLDSDDIWVSGRVQKCLHYFADNPDLDYVLGLQQNFLEPGIAKPETMLQEWIDNPTEASNNGVIMVKKSYYKKVGLYDESLDKTEDTDWIFRAKDQNLNYMRVPVHCLMRRIHGANLSLETRAETKSRIFNLLRKSMKRKTDQE